jgi:AcrR family transcriptional regulator
MPKTRSRTRVAARVRRPYTQERGEIRRKLLLDTTVQLLRERHVEEITYQDIARAAGMPLASCYHFFPGKMELLAALIDHAGHWFAEVTLTALNAPAESWKQMLERLMDALASNYNEDLAFAQLFSAWKISRAVYPAHDQAYQQQAERMLAAIDRQFERPKLDNAVEIFTFATRVVDAGFRPSLELHGRITDFHLAEAKRAVVSYLLNYLPPVLPRRGVPSAPPGEPAGRAWSPPPHARKAKFAGKR